MTLEAIFILILQMLVFALLVWLVLYIIGRFIPIPEPLRTVIIAVAAILLLLWVIQRSGLLRNS